MNSVARRAGTLTLVMIASAVVLGSPQDFSVPDDVALRIRLDDTLTSVDSEVGDPFSATVVDRGDYQNARVYGHVSEIDPSGKLTGHTSMMLRFDRLVMPDGRRAPIHAEIVELYHVPSGEKVEVEGAIESGGQGRKSVEHTVIGAGAGALLGGILRRRKGRRHRFNHRRCGRTGNHHLPWSSEDHAQQRPGNVNSNHDPPILGVASNRLIQQLQRRSMIRKLILVSIFTVMVTPEGFAQSSKQEPTIGELQKQMEEMRSEMAQMQNRIAELEAARGIAATSSSADPVPPRSVAPPARALQLRADDARSAEEPTSIRYRGLTLTPGGFLEGTMLVRTRNENADIANNYSAIPLNGSSNAKLTEFRGTSRNSEFSLLIQGTAGSATLKGYVETDFLGAAPTANYVESNSWTPRLRQLWVQLDWPSGWSITSGQTWSLLTTNEHGIATLAELRPGTQDGQYVVGFTWTRQRALRVTKNFNDKMWAAFAVESPETTYSAAFVSPNIMGLNTSQNAATGVNLLPFLASYSNGFATSLAPDLVAKVAFEPGWGHFEIKALGRFFRDRIASTATTNGYVNTTEGYGVGFGALMPFVNKKLDVSLEGLLGQGIGRYGSSGLPDATLNPTTGALRPLREARIMGGLVYHYSGHLNLYTYGGDEYAGRYAFISPTGTAAGYGSPLVSYTGCANEVALDACSGADRNIYEATVGYWYRLFRGEHGRIEQGNQLVYIHRNLWSGIGRTPQGSDIVAYTSVRFYLP